jgi:predicted nucleic acid-binding protein
LSERGEGVEMAYVDTSIVIAYYFREDPNHGRAAKVIDMLKKENREMIISTLALIELYSTLSRKSKEYALPPAISAIDDEKLKVHTIVNHIIKDIGLRIIDDEPRVEQVNKTKLFHVYQRAVKYAVDLKLKTLDLLHIAYAILLANKGLVHMFTTLDNEIIAKGYSLEKLGLKLLHP